MKLLKNLLSAALVLCMLLAVLPAACAEDDARFAGKTWEEVIEDFNARLGVESRNAGYGYRNTVTGEEHFFNPDQYMVAASMYKVPLNMMVSERVYNGEISMDTLIGGLSYEKLQQGSIIHSDNDYARALWMYVGNGNYRSYRRAIAPLMGEDADTVDPQYYINNLFTPRQMIHCLTQLYDNAEHYPGVIDCMKLAEPNEYFRRSENRYEIAHKYGYWEDSSLHMNDCAIVYTDEPILIVCFTDGLHNAYQVLAEFCTLMCDYAQYELDHRKAAEGALDAALSEIALPEFKTQKEQPLPTPTPEPTPEPTAEPAEEAAVPQSGFSPLWILLAFAGGGAFLLCALGRHKLRLRRMRLLAGVLSLFLAVAAGAMALITLSPAMRPAEDGMLPAMNLSDVVPFLGHPDPQEDVMAFFDALELQDYEKFYSMLDGYSSLGLEDRPEAGPGRMILGALRDSYSYRLEGESRVSGDLGEQEVYLRSLDLKAVEETLREETRSQLEIMSAERTYRELCDENGFYLPQVVEEAVNAATGVVLGRIEDFYADHTLTLHLLYSEGWYVQADDALVNAVLGA